jgi:hypothetical protein
MVGASATRQRFGNAVSRELRKSRHGRYRGSLVWRLTRARWVPARQRIDLAVLRTALVAVGDRVVGVHRGYHVVGSERLRVHQADLRGRLAGRQRAQGQQSDDVFHMAILGPVRTVWQSSRS